MNDDIRELLARAGAAVEENATAIARITAEGRRVDQHFAATYATIKHDLALLARVGSTSA